MDSVAESPDLENDDYAHESEASGEAAPKSEAEINDEILKAAHAFIAEVEDAERDERVKALEDIEFSLGDQWPAEYQQRRAARDRPCLVINRVKGQIHQITNDLRQNRPSIKVHPVDDKADVETAKKQAGLIRHIEYNSNADVAYDTGADSAVRSGRGYWRVITAYGDPLSFDQDLLIKAIPNRFSVFFDPYSKEPDGSDATRAAVTEDLSPDAYRVRYPKSKLARHGQWEAVGNAAPAWVSAKSARVAEYFYIEYRSAEIALMTDGSVVETEQVEKYLARLLEAGMAREALPTVKRMRPTQLPKVCWVKLNGCEILEKTVWPGRFIPIVPVYGTVVHNNGKRDIAGIVRDAKDPQRMYNYWRSAETEAIALAPRAPFVGYEGQFEGKDEWLTANTDNHPFLEVKPVTIGGQLAPLPQRMNAEPAVQAISMAAAGAAEDLKSVNGLFDAAIGARSNETSGRAILARGNQAQTANFHFSDNMMRSIRHTGRICIDAMPSVYDAERTARIIGEEGDHAITKFNQPSDDIGPDGNPRIYDLSVGKYDVSVEVGPSYTTKRQEAAASMADLTKAYPQIMQIAGDLLVKNLDWPGAAELAERLKKTIPPELQDDPNQKKQPIPPQLQAQMQQMQMQLEQAHNDRVELLRERESRLIEIESKERIEMKKLEVQLEMKRAELDAKDSLALLNAEIASIEQRLQLLNQNVPIPTDAQPELGAAQDIFAPQADGVPPEMDGGALVGGEMQPPTGGESPGQSMGNPMPQEGPIQ